MQNKFIVLIVLFSIFSGVGVYVVSTPDEAIEDFEESGKEKIVDNFPSNNSNNQQEIYLNRIKTESLNKIEVEACIDLAKSKLDSEDLSLIAASLNLLTKLINVDEYSNNHEHIDLIKSEIGELNKKMKDGSYHLNKTDEGIYYLTRSSGRS